MVGIALYLLCVGILSTGSTREQIYRRSDAIRGGRACCVMAIILAYLLNILWMLALSITAVMGIVYYVFSELCSSITVVSESNCLDFSVFRPLIRDISQAVSCITFPTAYPHNRQITFITCFQSLVLCGGTLQQFCAVSDTVVAWYFIGFIGSLLICLGLVQFMASNAANYSHVYNEERYNELRDVVFSDSYPEYSPNPNIYAPPVKYPLGTPQMNGTLSTYNYGTQPRNALPPPPMSHQGSMLRQQPNGTMQYPHSRRNSYHNSFQDNLGWPSSQY